MPYAWRPAGGDKKFGFAASETKFEVGTAIDGKFVRTLAAMLLGSACFTQSRKAGVSTVTMAARAPDSRRPS